VAAAVVAAPSAHIDETSWAEANEKAWLWVGQTDDLTAFTIADNRGADVARLILGTDKTKVVASDRFPSYDWIEQHQYCWSHLRRDFQAMIDRRDVGSASGTELLGSSDRLFHWWLGGGRQLDLLADGRAAAVERHFDLLSPWFSWCESQKTT
jgi:transposase